MIKVLLTDNISQKAVEMLKEIPEFEIEESPEIEASQLRKKINNFDAIVIRSRTKLDSEILENAQSLKLIVRAGTGLENIDVKYASKNKIEVKDTPAATAIAIAEFTIAQIFSIARFIGPAYRSMKDHKWEKMTYTNGIELFGKTAGIIGFNSVGHEVAKRELAMGMEVLFYHPVAVDTDLKARQVPIKTLLTDSDIISIHIPLSSESRNLISKKEFDLMKETAILVNISQSGVVNEAALMKALKNNRISAIGLDVFDKEPPDNFELIDDNRVFPAPRLGASTMEGQKRAGIEAVKILKEFFNV